jgi:phosphoketolase
VLNLVYSGLNRLVRRTGHRTLLVTGPEHGAPAIHANLWLEGTHREYDRALSLDGAGMAELVRRFSWPSGSPRTTAARPVYVHGYLEEGTTTTPFDLLVSNRMSRYDLARDAVTHAVGWSSEAGDIGQDLLRTRHRLRAAAYRDGTDPDEISGWRWS